jgi:hypothetical protein
MMHGRGAEQERLAGLVRDAADGRSFALLLEGPAGIGKTTLLEHAVAQAEGMLVLRASGYEAEIGIPYAGLSTLLGPVIEQRAALPATLRTALGGALALEEAPPPDRFAVPVATLALLGALADEQPVLVAVDDVHWLDDATRDALIFVAQRLSAEGVGVLLASRDAPHRPIDAPGLERLRVPPIGRDAALAVLADGPLLGDEVREMVVAVGAGNPLALQELPRSLSDDERAGRVPMHGPPVAGDEIGKAFAAELAGLPSTTNAALVVVAAGVGTPRDAVAVALERSGFGPDALEPAVAAGVLNDDGRRFAFRHPLLGAAAYHAAPSSEQRAAHVALAAASGHSARRAWHLAAAALGTDAEAAEALRAVGASARERAAHGDAARAFARAAELAETPAEQEALALEAARDAALAGHAEQTATLLDRALGAEDPSVRAAAVHLRAHLLMRGGSPGDASAALERLSADAPAPRGCCSRRRSPTCSRATCTRCCRSRHGPASRRPGWPTSWCCSRRWSAARRCSRSAARRRVSR